MRLPKEFYILVFLLVVVALVLGLLINKSGGGVSVSSFGETACKMDAESRNLEWRYSPFSGCRVLTKSGAWIPLAQFDHPSQVP